MLVANEAGGLWKETAYVESISQSDVFHAVKTDTLTQVVIPTMLA